MARGLKFRIYIEERMYYPCSENKGADQLRGYRESDLPLCFRICKKSRFSHNEAHIICINLEIKMHYNQIVVIFYCYILIHRVTLREHLKTHKSSKRTREGHLCDMILRQFSVKSYHYMNISVSMKVL